MNAMPWLAATLVTGALAAAPGAGATPAPAASGVRLEFLAPTGGGFEAVNPRGARLELAPADPSAAELAAPAGQCLLLGLLGPLPTPAARNAADCWFLYTRPGRCPPTMHAPARFEKVRDPREGK